MHMAALPYCSGSSSTETADIGSEHVIALQTGTIESLFSDHISSNEMIQDIVTNSFEY